MRHAPSCGMTLYWCDSSRDMTHHVTWLIMWHDSLRDITHYMTWLILRHDSSRDITSHVTQWVVSPYVTDYVSYIKHIRVISDSSCHRTSQMGRDSSHAHDMASFHSTACICCMVSSLRVTWLMMWHDSPRDVTHYVTWLITGQISICNMTPYVTWLMMWHDSLYHMTHDVTWLIHGIVASRDVTHYETWLMMWHDSLYDMTHDVTWLIIWHDSICNMTHYLTWFMLWHDSLYNINHNATWLIHGIVASRDMTHYMTWLMIWLIQHESWCDMTHPWYRRLAWHDSSGDMTHYVTCLDVSHRYVTQRFIFYSFCVIHDSQNKLFMATRLFMWHNSLPAWLIHWHDPIPCHYTHITT